MQLLGHLHCQPLDHCLLLSQSKMEEPWTIYSLVTLQQLIDGMAYYNIDKDIDCSIVWLGACIIIKTLAVKPVFGGLLCYGAPSTAFGESALMPVFQQKHFLCQLC